MYENEFYLENSCRPELTLENNCGYKINQNQIQINIEKINNNREIGNLSGSLSIELWALPQAYEGNYFSNSHCMASINIGEIYGQHFLENCQYDLTLSNPPVGTWFLCLMLREYNGYSYETVDYRNFDMPYFVEYTPCTVSEILECTNELEEKECTEVKTIKCDEKKADVRTSKKQAVKTIKSTDKINLNSATENEIAQIKGVSKKLAALIVSSRPFKTSKDLSKVKGVGKKLLENILEQSKI